MHKASKLGARRLLRLVLIALAPAAAIAAAAVVWRDRTLAEVERRLEERRPEQALEAANAFLARRPGNARALALKARALAELGRWDEASRIFSQVGVQSPEEMQAWATALVHRQRWSDALPVLARLLELNPRDPVALRHAAACWFQLGQAQAALDSAARLAAIPGREAEGLFLAGVVHRAQGEIHRAVEHWARIEELRPDGRGLPIAPAEFFLVYGEDLLAEGRPRAARSKLEKSRKCEETLEVLLQLGKAWAVSGNGREAAAAWTAALRHDAHNPEARQGLAELALDRSDPEDALQWLTPIAVRPDVSSTTAYLMERAYTLLGDEEALEHWQRRTAELRLSEKRRAALQRRLRERP